MRALSEAHLPDPTSVLCTEDVSTQNCAQGNKSLSVYLGPGCAAQGSSTGELRVEKHCKKAWGEAGCCQRETDAAGVSWDRENR